ncbi:hypothetical protein L1887_08935 [Cichorium endivia]|nr:hypothetical protein L1887_08935 [Cichorium endivia]
MPMESCHPDPFSGCGSTFRVNSVRDSNGDETTMHASSAYQVFDIMPDCTLSDLKATFRAKVKQFHPDVRQGDDDNSDIMIRHVIQAYEVDNFPIINECLDPFYAPECEAFDIFVNEVLCAGKGCPYSCVKARAYKVSDWLVGFQDVGGKQYVSTRKLKALLIKEGHIYLGDIDIGIISSVENNHKLVDIVKKGQKLAIKVGGAMKKQ